MEGADEADEVAAARRHHGELEGRLDALRARVREEGVAQVAGERACEQRRAVGAQRVEQLLRVERGLGELRANRPDDARVRVSNVKNAETTQTINVLVARRVEHGCAAWRAVAPLDGCKVVGDALAILEEAAVDVVLPAGCRADGMHDKTRNDIPRSCLCGTVWTRSGLSR